MNAKRLLALVMKEAWEMWLPLLTKASESLTHREERICKASFDTGWEACSIHIAREQKPVAWVVVGKDGHVVSWISPMLFDPHKGGYMYQTSRADEMEPHNAPHTWQPLVLGKIDLSSNWDGLRA